VVSPVASECTVWSARVAVRGQSSGQSGSQQMYSVVSVCEYSGQSGGQRMYSVVSAATVISARRVVQKR